MTYLEQRKTDTAVFELFVRNSAQAPAGLRTLAADLDTQPY